MVAAPPSFSTLPMLARLLCGWFVFVMVSAAYRLSLTWGLWAEVERTGYVPTWGQSFNFWVTNIGFLLATMIVAFLALVALIGHRAPSSVYLAAFATALGWPIPQLLWGNKIDGLPLFYQLLDVIPALTVFIVLFATRSVGETYGLRTPFNNQEDRANLLRKIRGRD